MQVVFPKREKEAGFARISDLQATTELSYPKDCFLNDACVIKQYKPENSMIRLGGFLHSWVSGEMIQQDLIFLQCKLHLLYIIPMLYHVPHIFCFMGKIR